MEVNALGLVGPGQYHEAFTGYRPFFPGVYEKR